MYSGAGVFELSHIQPGGIRVEENTVRVNGRQALGLSRSSLVRQRSTQFSFQKA
jgi:hypothetical protein